MAKEATKPVPVQAPIREANKPSDKRYRYRLKYGTHNEGDWFYNDPNMPGGRYIGETYHQGEIFDSRTPDLVERLGDKFERVSDDTPLSKDAAKSANKSRETLDNLNQQSALNYRATFEEMTLDQLRQQADADEIDVSDCKDKAAVIDRLIQAYV